jgi:dihydrodipicolinate synthase/N-acetylneuraminate lyase
MATSLDPDVQRVLQRGVVIPAHPLALTAERKLDERRQRALSRYYIAAGAGGLAIGVHTTQFAIRAPEHGLYAPLLTLTAEEMDRADAGRAEPLIRVAGVCGTTETAVKEAKTAEQLGYHAALLNMSAVADAGDDDVLEHCRAVSEVLPLFGFYLQPAVGGRLFGYRFWRRFAEIERLVAIKIAPFNRYQTIDVIRAVAEAGRDDVALYTGNDDNIIIDLLTPYCFDVGGRQVTRRMVGGLLGHWAVWTQRAVQLLELCRAAVDCGAPMPAELLQWNVSVTDGNAAVFDAANGYAGVIAGVHEVLRRQGLLEGIWCLDPKETLSPGQAQQLDRVCRAYPQLTDDQFVAEHLDEWLES